MSRPLLVRGGRVLDVATGRWLEHDLLLAAGRVVVHGAPGSLPERSGNGGPGAEVPAASELLAGAEVLDATGLLVTPGLVDAQVNGAAGADLTREPHRLPEVARALLRYGVTAFVPTVISSPAGTVEAALAAAAVLPSEGGGVARVVGVHAEGPFLAPARRGAHPIAHLRPPDRDLVAGWSRAAGVVTVTLAPELPGAVDVIRDLVSRGVGVWLGHTEASHDCVLAAVDAGARGVTHLFNAMPPASAREPGLVGAALEDPRLTSGVIVDGHHVHPVMVRLAWNTVRDTRFLLVSDATAALGLAPGRAVLGDQDVVLADGAVRLAGAPSTLAGSAVGLDHCVRTLVAVTGCDPAEAFVAATRVPADLLGRPDLGRLDPGAAADVALWTPDLALRDLILAGHLVPRL